MQSRRQFIRHGFLAAGGVWSGGNLLADDLITAQEDKKVTILHTNDVHSRLQPFPMDGGRNQGLGGVIARADIINSIRREEVPVLLLDAGDIFQGTPYFNIYKGEPEIKAMSAMGYEAATIGNHDFDGGLENLATQLTHATFPMVVCNYDFTATPMEHKYQPYTIVKKGKLKIGITGVGIEMNGLVPDNLSGNTKYLDPVTSVNNMAALLKQKHRCDMVICLSHLGYEYRQETNRISDVILAKESTQVDLIIGGHTHTFLPTPVVLKNKQGSDVIINQVGWAGIVLGRLDFEFSKAKNKNFVNGHTVVVGKKTRE